MAPSQVAAWGGYVFIINLIPLHVLALIALGRYSQRVYVAYSSFYVLGTLMAMQARARLLRIASPQCSHARTGGVRWLPGRAVVRTSRIASHVRRAASLRSHQLGAIVSLC
jgi:hypothetical protein